MTARSHDTVAQLRFTSLASASLALGRHRDHLIEICLRDGADANAAVRGDACGVLLGDLRLLEMRPNFDVADDQRTVVLGPRPQ